MTHIVGFVSLGGVAGVFIPSTFLDSFLIFTPASFSIIPSNLWLFIDLRPLTMVLIYHPFAHITLLSAEHSLHTNPKV